jgi:hypothetical protein
MKHIAAICIGLFSIAVLTCEGKSMKELHGEQKAVDPGNTAIQGFTMEKKFFSGTSLSVKISLKGSIC